MNDNDMIPARKLKQDCKLGCGADQCPFLMTSHHRNAAGRLMATKHTCAKADDHARKTIITLAWQLSDQGTVAASVEEFLHELEGGVYV